MVKSKFIRAFLKLSPAEQKRFCQYAASPFFNRQMAVVQLTDIVSAWLSAGKEKELDERVVFKKLFPRARFNITRMHNILSDTYALLLDYLAYTEYESDSRYKKINVLSALRKKELHHLF